MTPLVDQARRAAGLCPGERARLLEELADEVERLTAELAEARRPKSLFERIEAATWFGPAGPSHPERR